MNSILKGEISNAKGKCPGFIEKNKVSFYSRMLSDEKVELAKAKAILKRQEETKI